MVLGLGLGRCSPSSSGLKTVNLEVLVGNTEGEAQKWISIVGWKIKIREVRMAEHSI